MAEIARIVRDPGVLGGKPVVRGTRIAVEHVLEMIETGMGEAEICRSYPRLTPEDVRAAVAYAKAVVQRDRSSAA
jgi:uncharacterized protein (DUF433 family)